MANAQSRLSMEKRRRASIDMTLYYFNSQWVEWRYVQILTIKKLLEQKYSFFQNIVQEGLKESDEASIAQEITHGLYLDAIAQCVQYIEDLFALIRASKDPDYFIRNIITYNAGQVTSMIKTFKLTDKDVLKAFHIPLNVQFQQTEYIEAYRNGAEKLRNILKEIIEFFTGYEFIYIQYKHGLTIPMRTFGNRFTTEQVEKEKDGLMPLYLTVFDNLNLKAATIKKTFSSADGILMPAFTDNVRLNITQLQNENNYLRLVFPPDKDLNIARLESIAVKVKYCINIFKYNFSWKLIDKPNEKHYQLPIDVLKNITMNISYTESEN
jgi:hypothetical protein